MKNVQFQMLEKVLWKELHDRYHEIDQVLPLIRDKLMIKRHPYGGKYFEHRSTKVNAGMEKSAIVKDVEKNVLPDLYEKMDKLCTKDVQHFYTNCRHVVSTFYTLEYG